MGDHRRLSLFLAKLLRHEAQPRGLDITTDGYIDIEDVLSQQEARGHTEADIQRIVDNDRKGRFKIRTYHGATQIKATQGHSMQLEHPELTPINHYSEARVVLHGTRSIHWPSIKLQGISRRNRTHIHFARGENNVQSGFPPSCDMAIEIDMEKALRGGLKFYKSENDVILCSGNSEGVIPPKYFKHAYNLRTRERMD